MTIDARSSTTGTPVAAQHVAGLAAGCGGAPKLVPAVAEAAEVDDAPHAGVAGRRAEVAGGRSRSCASKSPPRAHRVDQVVGRVDAGERARRAIAGSRQSPRTTSVPAATRPARPRAAAPGSAPVARRARERQEPPADVAGRAREEDAARVRMGHGRQAARAGRGSSCGRGGPAAGNSRVVEHEICTSFYSRFTSRVIPVQNFPARRSRTTSAGARWSTSTAWFRRRMVVGGERPAEPPSAPRSAGWRSSAA